MLPYSKPQNEKYDFVRYYAFNIFYLECEDLKKKVRRTIERYCNV